MQLSSTTLATESESAAIIYSPAFCLRCQMFRARLQNLGDHILNTVSSINLSQMRFRSGRRKKGSEARIFFFSPFPRKRHICVQIGLSFRETTFMILLLVLSHHPLSSSVEKRASLQSGFLLFERSKLHQVDGEVCFTCHSVELPPNEMLHTDFCLRAQGDKTVVTE